MSIGLLAPLSCWAWVCGTAAVPSLLGLTVSGGTEAVRESWRGGISWPSPMLGPTAGKQQWIPKGPVLLSGSHAVMTFVGACLLLVFSGMSQGGHRGTSSWTPWTPSRRPATSATSSTGSTLAGPSSSSSSSRTRSCRQVRGCEAGKQWEAGGCLACGS